MKRVLFSLLLSSLLAIISAQGEPCTTPTQQRGVCIVLPECLSLVNLYAKDKSRNTVNLLIAAQKSCGNRAVGRNPILCCSDGVNTPPPPTQPPTPAPTAAPTKPFSDECTTPNGGPGQCRNIANCQPIVDELKARSQDPEFKQYIQKSNEICNFVTRSVCCPSGPLPPPTVENHRGLFTPDEGCGYSNVTHPRVVGGVPSKLGGWPWMALLAYRNDFGDVSFKCGGSLITTRHVLTAAHCMRKDLFSVRLGEHDISTDAETKTVDIEVAQQIVHPNYDRKDGHSDIAILVLREPVKSFGFTIRPVCIPLTEPVRSRDFEGTNPFVAGWGRTTEGGKSANVLQEVQFPVLKNQDCATRYEKLGRLQSQKQFNDATLCAGKLTGGKDAAPVRHGAEFLYYQIGVVSYGIGCARADVPGVYTRVQHFADWINEQVQNT